MTYLSSKKRMHKFMYTIGHEHVLGGISKETLDLAIALAKSIEADEERLARIKHFNSVIEVATKDAAKYNKVGANI